MDWRYFDYTTDRESAARLWHEVGWLNRHDSQALEGMNRYLECVDGLVAEGHGVPQCFVFTVPGTFRYQAEDLPLAAITSVATGYGGRKQGLARRLTARILADVAAKGAALAGLSTFEQGFYDQLGFGTGAYEPIWRFDPARLTVDDKVRPPHRLDVGHRDAMHQARMERKRHHGAVTLTPVNMTQADVLRTPEGFGLGYYDDGPAVPSHGLWCEPTAPLGPHTVKFMTWKTPAQFLELMGLIKQWGDQVRLVVMTEPSGIQLQDMMDRPTQHFQSTHGSTFASGLNARANFQYRILDLTACIAVTHLTGPALTFNLKLTDPMGEGLLSDDGPECSWRGISGEYTVHLGAESQAKPGTDPTVPTLNATVGAFTRLWMGVRPATGLAVTDRLSGPEDLLSALDDALRLPVPRTDWPY